MNAHDSERLAGLLDAAGYQPAGDGETPDVVVFNTCAVRENAADRLYGNLGHLLPQKKKGMQIAVGGCLAQMERTRITQRAPWVDVVYGTPTTWPLPALLERARVRNEAQAEFAETLETFPSLLPARRESVYSAWVAISVGCNNTCTFCIVPSLRGKEKDRRPGDILDEIRALVADGVLEVTLLGQNVNSYGAEFGDRNAFGKLLRGCGEIEGLERVRFTSPHPRISPTTLSNAMAETPNVMPSLHMPLQSGSDRDPEGHAPRLPPGPLPGHPGPGPGQHPRCRHHHRHHRRLPRRDRAGLRPALWTWCARPGSLARSPSATPSARAPPPPPWTPRCPRRSCRSATSGSPPWSRRPPTRRTRSWPVRTVEVLVAEGEGRKDAATHRMSGRARDNRLVHFTPDQTAPRPGDVVTVTVTRGAPHYLLSDAAPLAVRRTRAGDAWQAAATASAAVPPPAPAAAASPLRRPVLLGMPARPATTVLTPNAAPGPLLVTYRAEAAVPAGPRLLVEAVQEADQAGEARGLVVVHGQVAAVRAVQVAPSRQAAGHHLHVARVHGVVPCADDQRRHLDRGPARRSGPSGPGWRRR